MKRTTVAILFGTGLLAGLLISGMRSPIVLAQTATGWECKAWTVPIDGSVSQLGTWLSTAKNVHLTSAGLSNARYTVTACKQ
jgi:hypothetical protein